MHSLQSYIAAAYSSVSVFTNAKLFSNVISYSEASQTNMTSTNYTEMAARVIQSISNQIRMVVEIGVHHDRQSVLSVDYIGYMAGNTLKSQTSQSTLR